MASKVRVLCLHGWGTNSEIMNYQLRHFRASFGEDTEFVVLQAPNEIRKQSDHALEARFPGTYYEWFRREKIKNEHESFVYETRGLERSIEVLEKFIEENGPFDGVLGFSQGGVMAMVLISLSASGRLKTTFKFGLLVAVAVMQMSEYWEHMPPDFPIIFFVGTKDPFKDSTYSNATYFTHSQFLTTEDDHRLPKLSPDEVARVKEFMRLHSMSPKL
mmetsp:Transcript_13558/g.25572  ORF Transcript_13558/g.25572 Transcript_13558/m.25572 type:complete len:217 (+) Transcript_13558:214-864(+)